MKNLVIWIALIASVQIVDAQQITTSTGKFWVYFNDKGPEASTILANYHELLPKAMVEAHEKRGLAINSDDLPVSKTYLAQLITSGYKVHGNSRWLNAAVIDATEVDVAKLKAACPSIAKIIPMALMLSMNQLQPGVDNEEENGVSHKTENANSLAYGKSRIQNQLIGLQCLHDDGYTGNGVKIAVLDASFESIDSCAAFRYIRNNNLIKARYNVINGSTNINGAPYGHGTAVTSVISANVPDTLVGAAFNASLYLVVAENATAPYYDINFIKAAEWADSLGVDIIQCSLGYFYPPDSAQQHVAAGLEAYTIDKLDGHSTPITQIAQKASSKGIMFIAAVGDPHYFGNYIFSPSDGDSVLGVGGVLANGKQSPNATFRRTADGRIKPDVDALATNVYIAGFNSICAPDVQSGTSVSAPIISGLAALLKESNPTASGWRIIQAIKYSSSRAPLKNDTLGFGVPNACKADSLLRSSWVPPGVEVAISEVQLPASALRITPSPAQNTIAVEGVDELKNATILNLLGQEVSKWNSNNQPVKINVGDLLPGIYLLIAADKQGQQYTARFVKQ